MKHKMILRTLGFSFFIAALILLSVLTDKVLKISLPVSFAVLPLVVAGGYVIYTTTYVLSRRTYRIIGQNIFIFACCVNVIGVTLSILGFLNPMIGVVVHNASSIFVVLNSSKMLTWGKKRREV